MSAGPGELFLEYALTEKSKLPNVATVRTDLFGYDSAAALRFAITRTQRHNDVLVAVVRYDNGTGATVDAYVATPRSRVDEPLPGVVLAHGGFEPGKHLFLDQAVELSAAGFAVLAADTTFPRSGNAAAVEAAIRSGVVIHRRSLDVLQEHYGSSRLGLFGHSKGGSEGAVLSAVEPRLNAIVIGGMGSASPERKEVAYMYTIASTRQYFEAIYSFDAGLYLSVPGQRRLLVQHGISDNAVTLAESRAMFDAASDPKAWREYDCGHGIDSHQDARSDRIAFFRHWLDLP